MISKLKLCIDARMVNSSGIGVYIRNIIPYVAQRFDVTLLGRDDELAGFKVAGIVSLKSNIYSIDEQFELTKKIPVCDIFWSPHYNIPVMNIPARKRVVTIHDVYHLAFYEQLSLKQKIYAKLVINKAIKKSDAVITVSDFSKNEIVKYTGCDPQKIQVVYNGIQQVPVIKDIQSIREKYQLPSRYLLFVGNVKPHKNIRNLLKAYLLMDETYREKYKIVVVGKKTGFINGDEQLFSWMLNEPLLKDNLIFTGYVADEDVDTIYRHADVFVFPSLYEGFGLPPLEAMRNGCATALSDIPSLKEVCGDAGYYFDPQSPDDIRNKLTHMLEDQNLRQHLIKKGEERIRAFSWENAAEQHIRIFNK